MTKKIKAGFHTVDEILARANFDLAEKAQVDYNPEGVDRRRIKIGGLGFDSGEDVINVPVTADILEITVDGQVDTTLEVELTAEQKKLRVYSFETAAEANEPKSTEG